MPNRWTDDFQSRPFRDGSFESEKITNSEARSQNRMMRMECRRNTSVISNYGLEIRDKKHDHHYQPTDWTDCTIGAGFRRSDGCNRNLDRLMHPCTAIAINGDSYRLKEHKLNKLLNNLQAAKELKPKRHDCRGQDLSARGSTYLTVDRLASPVR